MPQCFNYWVWTPARTKYCRLQNQGRDMIELEAGAHIAPQHPYKDFKTKGFFWPNVDWNGFTTWEGVGER